MIFVFTRYVMLFLYSKWLLSEKCSFTAESNAFVEASDGALNIERARNIHVVCYSQVIYFSPAL